MLRRASKFKPAHKQRGAAFIVMVVILVIGITTFYVNALSATAIQNGKDKITALSLAQARDALIGYSVSVKLDSGSDRPGHLPCPDIDNDGSSDTPCGDASGSNQSLRLGRLPWRTLNLPDLRDGSGERLWYAVSNNFKKTTATPCTVAGQTTCLNSDTAGSITLRNKDGLVLFDSGTANGLAAVIISPSAALIRIDNISQSRSCTIGTDCDSTEKCTSPTPTTSPKCNPQNYLDLASLGGEDNANFIDASSSNGFIQGPIKDSNENYLVNDQVMAITVDDIMQSVQKRVAAEVRQCLNEYAANSINKGRYPWPARLKPTNPPSYGDKTDYLFGRLPDTPFNDTQNDSGGDMGDTWYGDCNINSTSGWWLNWKEMVFYSLADAFKPEDPLHTPASNACDSLGACLKVSPPTSASDKHIVVIVAGKKLFGQSRASDADKGDFSNYLETPNPTPAYTGSPTNSTDFSEFPPTATFNDTIVFQ